MDLFEPVLELSLEVTRISLHAGFHEPNVVIAVETSNGARGRWIKHSQTESVQTRKDCSFMKTISFYTNDKIDASTKLQFIFKRLRKNDQTETIGSGFCLVGELINSENPRVKLNLSLNSSLVGFVQIQIVRVSSIFRRSCLLNFAAAENTTIMDIDNDMSCLSRNHGFKHLLINPINRTYRFSNCDGEDLAVYEYMLETPLSIDLPVQYLEMCHRETMHAVKMLENMVNLKEQFQSKRVTILNKCREHLIQYKARIDSMKKYKIESSCCIKKSADKTSEELEFVPINLHVQHMRVNRHRKPTADQLQQTTDDRVSPPSADGSASKNTDEIHEYSFVTVGAAAAHSKGFKQGGLLTLLSSNRIEGKSGRKLIIAEDQLKKSLDFGGLSERDLVTNLEEDVNKCCDKLNELLDQMKSSIENPNSDAQQFDILDQISAKMGQFVVCCDNSDLGRAHERMTSNMVKTTASSILDPHQAPLTSTTCDAYWEEVKLKVKSSLALLVKSVDHQYVDHDDAESVDHDGATLNVIELVKENIRQLRMEVQRALFHLNFTQISSIDFYSDLFYRRRIAFSQALSMCACGVATIIYKTASEKRVKVFEQYDKCGFLLQVESLLSTYGGETGMIQDYVIGVMDLCKVSVQFEKKIDEKSSSPVQLIGSSLQLIIKVFLEESSFSLLPQRFQDGGFMKIHPTFFNVGINQEQTLAEKFGDTALQDYLNRDSFQRLVEYHEKVVQLSANSINNYPERASTNIFAPGGQQTNSSNTGFIPRMKSTITAQVSSHSCNVTLDRTTNGKTTYEVLDKIRSALNSNKSKPVEILQLAAEICRRLNGLRVTSCKSAKDRTAMSVTLEQASILLQEHDIEEKTFHTSLSVMRSNGTRLENTMKNVGQRKYAFASVQLMTFPKLYRPPDGTYGKVES